MLRRFADQSLQNELARLRAELDAKARIIAVKDAELQSMAAVIARDRERVKAETAAFSRQRAECEGLNGRSS